MLSNWLCFFSALVCIITLTQGKQYHLGWLIFEFFRVLERIGEVAEFVIYRFSEKFNMLLPTIK